MSEEKNCDICQKNINHNDCDRCDYCEEKFICDDCICDDKKMKNWFHFGNGPTYCPECLLIIKKKDIKYFNILKGLIYIRIFRKL